MRIYVDLDDVLGDTVTAFLRLTERLFGRKHSYESIRSFDLRESLGLTAHEYLMLMDVAHKPEALLAIQPFPEAVSVMKSWQLAGAAITVVTGRPPDTYNSSAEWLTVNNFAFCDLVFVDKYGRNQSQISKSTPVCSLADFSFDLAIEDSPEAARWVLTNTSCPVLLLDRPWNRNEHGGSQPGFVRVSDWIDIRNYAQGLLW